MFSVGSSIGMPVSDVGNPRRHRLASAGTPRTLIGLSPSRWLWARTVKPGPTGASVSTTSRSWPASATSNCAGLASRHTRWTRSGSRSAGSISRWATSFGRTSAMPTTSRSGRPVGRPFTVSSISRPSENLIGEPVDEGPHLGQHEAPPRTRDQGLAERLLEAPNLHAHRRRRQVQLGGGGGQGALPDERPEVQEVVVVQPFHGASDVRENQTIYWKQSNSLSKRNRLQETLAVRRARCWSS